MKNEFVTAINCMDGRVQVPVNRYLKTKYDARFVDIISEAGPISYILDLDNDILKNMYKKVNISIKIHKSNVLALCAHTDCAGVALGMTDAAQINTIKTAVIRMRKEFKDIEIIGLFVNNEWEVEEVI